MSHFVLGSYVPSSKSDTTRRNVGVNPTKLYELKEVSNDFFDEDEG